MKKFIAIILAAAMLVGTLCLSAYAQPELGSHCSEDCEKTPLILIPGIGQSNVWLLDENGNYKLDSNGNKINCFPAYVDIPSIVKTVLAPLVLSLITQHDIGLSKAVSKALYTCFGINACDENGKNIANIEVESYPYSFADAPQEAKDTILKHIPIGPYINDFGADHVYYFSYNSFGNHLDIAQQAYEFIQMVKEQTGHDKVNIVPISMGGTVLNGLMEYYPDIFDSIEKVICVVPALDGSKIVGEILTEKLAFLDKEYLYNGFLEQLMDEETARLVEIVLRLFPDDMLMNVLNAACQTLIKDVIATTTNMWTLCTSEDYPVARSKWLMGADKAEIRRQTDIYYQAQIHSKANIQSLVDRGVQVFNIVEYGIPLYNVVECWDDINADGIINLSSTAMGVYSANCGETLPEGYVQQNTYCSNPDHDHISPDNVVDASTGLLPDHTFYMRNQAHESTGRCDVIIKLIVRLATSDDIKDVYSLPDEFPQFNNGRDPRKLESRLSAAKYADRTGLTAEQCAELDALIAQAEEFLAGTIVGDNETQMLVDKLEGFLTANGLAEFPPQQKEVSTFGKVLIALSMGMYKAFGTAGFSQMPFVGMRNAAQFVTDVIHEYILEPVFGIVDR